MGRAGVRFTGADDLPKLVDALRDAILTTQCPQVSRSELGKCGSGGYKCGKQTC